MFKNFLNIIGLSKKSQVRTRFAPSPTGYLHIGGLRTALYSYLFAKQNQGQFILRLEDTDLKRYVEGAAEAIYNGLKWAGIKYDEGPDVGGLFGPYIQSQRLEIYQKYADELLEKKLAYRCFCDETTLEEMKKEQIAKNQAPKYDRRCLNLSKEKIEEKLKNKTPGVIRMKIPENRKIEFDDIVRGHIIYNSDELDDQILLKSDGYPTYHLAVVVDDHLMKISHVTRTEEWLPSTPKHILLYEYFGWKIPRFAHLPLLLNPDKTKMSKRKGDVALEDYIKKGYLPEAMINYLAFLGWNPASSAVVPRSGTKGEKEKEIYSMEELLRDFDLNKVHKAGAIFNIEKLNWYNQYYLGIVPKTYRYEYILKTSTMASDTKVFTLLDVFSEKISPKIKEFFPKERIEKIIEKTFELERLRGPNIEEMVERSCFYLIPHNYDKELLRWKEMTDEKIKLSLEKSKEIILAIEENDFSAKNLAARFLAEAQKFPDRGELLWPLRAALSGQKNSPPPFEIAEILGKEECLKRIEKAIGLFV